jgi:hypothetical protein
MEEAGIVNLDIIVRKLECVQREYLKEVTVMNETITKEMKFGNMKEVPA